GISTPCSSAIALTMKYDREVRPEAKPVLTTPVDHGVDVPIPLEERIRSRLARDTPISVGSRRPAAEGAGHERAVRKRGALPRPHRRRATALPASASVTFHLQRGLRSVVPTRGRIRSR